MNTNNPKNTDHHDRLLDSALREVVGQETPPDLSKKILTAAGEQSRSVVSMNGNAVAVEKQQSRRRRKAFVGGAMAASLLIVPSMGLYHHQNTRNLTEAVVHAVKEKPKLSVADLRTCHRVISRQLRGKIERYQALAETFGGSEAKVNPVLNKRVHEIRQIKAEMMKAREELVEISVERAVAEQQGGNSSLLDQAVAKVLDQDPKLANYKAEEFALMHQIRIQRARVVRKYPSTIKHLEQTLGNLQRESQKYRMKLERGIRTALKNSVGGAIASLIEKEYLLRHNAITNQIAKLEKEYEEKVAKIEQMERSGELSQLEVEIEQLQAVESRLESQLRGRIIEQSRGSKSSVTD